MRRPRFWLCLLMALLLAGCRLPSMLAAPAGSMLEARQAGDLPGRVQWTRGIQATLPEVGSAATVSLVDAQTGLTLATTVTTSAGEFVFRFGRSFVPEPNRPYFLEAIKGIKGTGPTTPANEQFNQAGADAVRLRTVIFYQDSPVGWVSLANATPGSVAVNLDTTALSVLFSLKRQSGTPLDLQAFIGCVAGGTYAPVNGVSSAEFAMARPIVEEAVTQDRDPFQYTAYDASSGQVLSKYIGHAISAIAPVRGKIGTVVTVDGDGFDLGPPTVRFNGIAATVESVTKTRIKALVPVGANTGPVSVQIGTVTQAGPTFTVDAFDGHRSVLNGTLYVANSDRDEIAAVTADGVVRTFVAVPAGPSQVALGPDNLLYVACQSANKVVRIDPATKVVEDFALLTSPRGLAFLDGVLYVTSYSGGTVARFNLDKTSAGSDLTGFVNPAAVAFDYAGNLYAADLGSEAILRVASGSTTPETWAYVSKPMGICLDSGGSLYAASNDSNLIYRIAPSGASTVFARIPSPAGVMLDEQGYMYVASDDQQQIYRISSLGDVRPYAYGISNPRGLAVDPSGNLYVSLSSSNAILQVQNTGSGYLTRPFVTGIANPQSITYRNGRIYIAHRETNVVSSTDLSGAMRTEAAGLKVPGGADADADGTLYVGRNSGSVNGDTIPPNLPWHAESDQGGIDVVSPAKTVTTKYRLMRTSDHAITGLADRTYFALNNSTRALLAYMPSTDPTNPSYTYHAIATYAANPRALCVDASNNLYVTVTNENAIRKYSLVSGSWQQVGTLTGFTAPYRMTFDAANQVLYVFDTGDAAKAIKRVNLGAAATSADAGWWIAGSSASDPAYGLSDLAYRGGVLYLAKGSALKIDVYTLSSSAVTDSITGFSRSPDAVLAHPTDGFLYVRTGSIYIYKVSPTTKVISLWADYGGWQRLTALGMLPDGSILRAHSVYPDWSAPVYLSSLIQSHEVALDPPRHYLYVGSFMMGGIYRYDLVTGDEMLLRPPYNRAPHDTRDYYYTDGSGDYREFYPVVAVSTAGTLYTVSTSGRVYMATTDGKPTYLTTLGTLAYGLDITADDSTLWAIGSNRSLYSVLLTDNSVSLVRAGLSAPRF